jgi:ApbE superfamily uncharacterized protein (UPF0280 family)
MPKVPADLSGGPGVSACLPNRVGVPFQMPGGAFANWLDGHRLHLQHGPIDLIITAEGAQDDLARAYAGAAACFADILSTLVDELPALRAPASLPLASFKGPVAQRMGDAITPYVKMVQAPDYITPMAAVAGSVADHVLAAMGDGLDRAHVNNGGDIALRLGTGRHYEIGVADDRDVTFSEFVQKHRGAPTGPMPLGGRITVGHDDGVGGVATSGWRGRSLSFGIADSVTVLAVNAAAADIAATLIANAVTVDSPAVTRAPATEIDDDSDLGRRLVTVGVGPLRDAEITAALGNGRRVAARFAADGHIAAAYACLAGRGFVVGQPFC